MQQFSLILLAAMVSLVAAQSKKNVTCTRDDMDNCSNNLLMLGDPTFVFPTTMDLMAVRCKKLKSLEKCVKEYTQNCMSREAKQPISVFAYGITRTNKGFCSTNKRRATFINISLCANTHRKVFDSYMETMNREFHSIKSVKEAKNRIPMACCSYYKMKQSILSTSSKHCEQISPEIEMLLDGYAQDVLNLVCGDYTEDSDKCSVFKGKIPKWTKALEAKNFLLPLADIFNSL